MKKCNGLKVKGNITKSKFCIMLILVVLLSIKYIFVDFGIDGAFQISMSYRLATGDIMFKEMWEPYQMSTFLSAFFIKIYMLLFQTTTGMVLYLQTIGVLLDVAVAILLFRAIKKYLGCDDVAFLMVWVFLLISPKDLPLPEYANMQIWFSTLLCVTLFVYIKTNNRIAIILAALCLCATVLSYPSCLIIFFGAIALLMSYRKREGAFIFVGTCFIVGALYLVYIFSQVSVGEFQVFFENMFSLETSHSAGIIDKFISYGKEAFKIVLFFGCIYGLAYGLVRIIYYIRKDVQDKNRVIELADMIFLVFVMGYSIYTVLFWKDYVRYDYSIVFLAIILIGFHYKKRLSQDKLCFYICGMVISILQFMATLLLTNLVLMASVPYLLLGVIVSLLPLAEMFKEENVEQVVKVIKTAVLLFSIFGLIFRNVYIIRPMNGDVSSILNIRNIVREGPAIGIVSEYMGPYMQNESIKEWKQYIHKGDTIYLVGGSLDTLGYLYLDTNIAAPSLVPTPGYNESIVKYWEMNPHKYPNVIIASCWYGTMNEELSSDSWIMNWIEKEYRPKYHVDGKYWRYYFR